VKLSAEGHASCSVFYLTVAIGPPADVHF